MSPLMYTLMQRPYRPFRPKLPAGATLRIFYIYVSLVRCAITYATPVFLYWRIPSCTMGVIPRVFTRSFYFGV
jgi:hypothetical protein